MLFPFIAVICREIRNFVAMHFILTPEQMKQADAATTQEYGIPPLLLMENAARSAAELLLSLWAERDMVYPEVKIFCGPGNNGGDGFAMARHLHEHCRVSTYRTGEVARMTTETATNYEIVQKLGIPVYTLDTDDDVAAADFSCDCVVDALLGVGGNEEPRGIIHTILKKLGQVRALAVAVDVPTGFNSATGASHDDCFRADYTMTMQCAKTGMYLGDAGDCCGAILIAPFGMPPQVLADIDPVRVLDDGDIRRLLPFRKSGTSKHDYGTALVIGGALHMPGAPVMAAHAALGIGAGRVRLLAPAIHPAAAPELMTKTLATTDDGTIAPDELDTLLELAARAQAVVFGTGLGDNDDTIAMARRLIDDIPVSVPLVIDADGLMAVDRERTYGGNIVLTPHYGEFARLTGLDMETIRERAPELAVEWATRLQCTLLLKGTPTIISDGRRTYWNLTGNPAMATAGSGDVLSGLIGGLAAQGVEPFHAAVLAAYLHGRAGDVYVRHHAQETMRATDLIACIDEVLLEAERAQG